MRLGEILVAHGLVTEADVEAALARQRTAGGRLGDSLIAIGKLTAGQLAEAVEATPPLPRSVAATGIAAGMLQALLLKFMHFQPRETPVELGDAMRLPVSVIRELLDEAVQKKLVTAAGQTGDGLGAQIRYELTERGRAAAEAAAERNLYLGPAPVPLEVWQQQILRQRITNELVDPETLRKCFEGLVVPDHLLKKIGPAANSGHAVLLYGPPGNGKTSIATRLATIFKQVIYVPYAVDVDGHIMVVFDASLHKRAVSEEAAASLAQQGTLLKEEFDQRWAACRRPVVITGGELSLDMLDLRFNAEAKFYDAPMHIKALNGTFLIDDFGRQLLSPETLLNRWIVPLESRIEFLKLHTGKSFSIPFDEFIIFSTNMPPSDLMDPAFLRRIPYKIKLFEPSREDYRRIFRAVARHYGAELPDDLFNYIVHELVSQGHHLAYYQPKFICDQVLATCKYEGAPPHFTMEKIAEALGNLYVEIADRQSERIAELAAAAE